MQIFEWMAWTPPVAIFFASVGVLLAVMTIWEARSPTIARKGFLPLTTTRGDRLFIGLLASAYIVLAWIGLTDLPPWWSGIVGVATIAVVMRWG